MIIYFKNKTGKTISLHESVTKFVSNVESNEESILYETSDNFYKFFCNKPYLIIKISGEFYNIAILPMPIMGIEKIHLIIGINIGEAIRFNDGTMSIKNTYFYTDEDYLSTLYVGMGTYELGDKEYEKIIDIVYYRFGELKYQNNEIYGKLVKVEDIKEFMNAPPDINKKEKIQILSIIFIIIIIAIAILLLTGYGYSYSRTENAIY